MNLIPADISDRIFDILVGHAGAVEFDRSGFISHFSETSPFTVGSHPREYRCCGRWGMAGKFWWNDGRFYVSGHSRCEVDEDTFQTTLDECEEVNELLVPLYEEFRRERKFEREMNC